MLSNTTRNPAGTSSTWVAYQESSSFHHPFFFQLFDYFWEYSVDIGFRNREDYINLKGFGPPYQLNYQVVNTFITGTKSLWFNSKASQITQIVANLTTPAAFFV